jgi:hypothetical protein
MWEGRRVRLPPHRSFRDARSCLPCLRTHHSTPLSPAPMDCSAGAMCSYSCASGGRKRAARGASVITAAPPATVLEVSLELQRESLSRPVRERGQLSARAKDRSASCEWAVGARRLTLVLRHGYWYAAAMLLCECCCDEARAEFFDAPGQGQHRRPAGQHRRRPHRVLLARTHGSGR